MRSNLVQVEKTSHAGPFAGTRRLMTLFALGLCAAFASIGVGCQHGKTPGPQARELTSAPAPEAPLPTMAETASVTAATVPVAAAPTTTPVTAPAVSVASSEPAVIPPTTAASGPSAAAPATEPATTGPVALAAEPASLPSTAPRRLLRYPRRRQQRRQRWRFPPRRPRRCPRRGRLPRRRFQPPPRRLRQRQPRHQPGQSWLRSRRLLRRPAPATLADRRRAAMTARRDRMAGRRLRPRLRPRHPCCPASPSRCRILITY